MSASHSLYGITIIQERCFPLWRRNLQVLRHVSLKLSVRKNYRSAAFLSGDEISRSSGRSASHSLHGITITQERCFPLWQWNNNNSGAMILTLAMEFPGPRVWRAHTMYLHRITHTSGALPYCLALKSRQIILTLCVSNCNISGALSSSLAMESPGPQAGQPHTPCTE